MRARVCACRDAPETARPSAPRMSFTLSCSLSPQHEQKTDGRGPEGRARPADPRRGRPIRSRPLRPKAAALPAPAVRWFLSQVVVLSCSGVYNNFHVLAASPSPPVTPPHTHTHPASFSGACPRRGSVSLRPPRAASWASLPERGPSASFLGLSLTSPSLYTRHGTLNRMGGERVPIPYTEDMEMQLREILKTVQPANRKTRARAQRGGPDAPQPAQRAPGAAPHPSEGGRDADSLLLLCVPRENLWAGPADLCSC